MQGSPEELFDVEASAAGYEILRGGWPDRILLRGGELIFVEVKGVSGGYKEYLSLQQVRVLSVLQALGLKVRIAVDGQLGKLVSVSEYLDLTGWRVRARRKGKTDSTIIIEKVS